MGVQIEIRHLGLIKCKFATENDIQIQNNYLNTY